MMTNSTIKVYDEALHLQVEEYMAAHRLSQEQMLSLIHISEPTRH